jgi:hypothetical protein
MRSGVRIPLSGPNSMQKINYTPELYALVGIKDLYIIRDGIGMWSVDKVKEEKAHNYKDHNYKDVLYVYSTYDETISIIADRQTGKSIFTREWYITYLVP